MFSATDHGYMAQALRLAEKGLYDTSPNPRVGCVLVRDGKAVGSGWHKRAGEPHAEINALAVAGAAAQGATAYLTLEPCSHHGRTPPCAEALIKAGVAKVNIAMQDPNPLVSGRGSALLQEAGIEVRTGLMEADAKALKIGFIARMTRGPICATAYLTLEPCSHHGRTPPCAEALIKAGVAEVNIAMEDPNPLVSGRGSALLQEAGIEVRTGLMEADAKALNIGFIARMTRGRPWVRMKIAASLDGKTALNNGVSRWITGEAARRDGHRLRTRSCAVLTGIGTVLADNPQLTVRNVQTSRQPQRVVVDSRLDIPVE